MHPSPLFQIDDETLIKSMISASPFAMVAVNGADGPVVAMLPMLLSADETALIGHVAVKNDILACLEAGAVPATVIFQISEAYVSPSFYPSKVEHGRAVPTWNYEAIQVRGLLERVQDVQTLHATLEHLTDHMEADRPSRWQVSDAPQNYIDGLARGICGLHLTIKSIRCVRKLSQNKSDADFAGVIAGLSSEPRHVSQAMAKDIQKLREAQ